MIHIVGGGCQNELLNQMTADACGRPVVAGPIEATAIGNILVQAMATGDVKSLADAREIVRDSFDVKRYEPNASKQWEEPTRSTRRWRTSSAGVNDEIESNDESNPKVRMIHTAIPRPIVRLPIFGIRPLIRIRVSSFEFRPSSFHPNLRLPMVIDCHVHVSAFTPGHGSMSPRLLEQPAVPLHALAARDRRATTRRPSGPSRQARPTRIDETEQLDAAVVLAFDAVYDRDGRLDCANTHLYVTNDYVIELCRRHPKMLFGASVHPYRKDAVAEIERCVEAGAVLLKWLPIVQDFNPADERCFPFYEALAHHKLPLLSHTGGEKSLPIARLRPWPTRSCSCRPWTAA